MIVSHPMKKISFKFRFLLTVLLAGILVSCQFDTDEVYEDDTITPSDPPELNVIELTALPDSLFLGKPVTIRFSFESTNPLYGVIVQIDDIEYESFNTGSGEFTIDPTDFYMGYHTLNLVVVAKSNSGSIADKVGYEGFVFEGKDWIFFNFTRKSPPRHHMTTRSYSPTGGLELTWDSCWYIDALYTVEKYLGTENGSLIATSTTSGLGFSDMSYAGEQAFYRILVSGDEGNSWHPWYEITCDKDLPVPVLEAIEHQLILHWPYKPYMQNLHGFKLNDPEGGDFRLDLPAGDTSVILDDYYFGGNKSIEFHVIPGGEPRYYHENPAAFSNTTSHFFAERIPYVIGKGIFTVTNEPMLLFQQHSHNIHVLDLDSYEIVDSLYSEPDMSNSNFGYSVYLSASREKFCIKSLTKNAIHYGYSDDLLHHETFVLPFPASGTRVFLFDHTDEIILSNSRNFYYYNTLSKTIEDTLSFDDAGIIYTDQYLTFSPDGGYLLQKWDRDFFVFSVIGRKFRRLYEVDEGFEDYFDWVGFDQNRDSTLVQLDGENLYFKRPGIFSLVYSIPFENGFYTDMIGIDYANRRVLWLDRSVLRLRVLDLDQGTILEELTVHPDIKFKVWGNTLLTTSGLRMDFGSTP